jgi:hypothetical protein
MPKAMIGAIARSSIVENTDFKPLKSFLGLGEEDEVFDGSAGAG